MELTIMMRIRVAVALSVGVAVLGLLAWPLVRPDDPTMAVTLYTGFIGISDMIICAVLAFAAGFLAYFAAYPFGMQIAPMAVPAGLATWSFLAGDMKSLIRLNPLYTERLEIYASFKWEALFWLALTAIGYTGVLAASKIIKSRDTSHLENPSNKNQFNIINIAFTIVVSTIIANFVVMLLAKDVSMYDKQLGSVIGQPAAVQIAFAVMVAFGAAAFVAKYFLKTSYIAPAVCTVILSFIGVKFFTPPDVLEYMSKNWPVAFYPGPISTILPIQMVAFGVIGAVVGYWAAVKYDYWRKNEQA